jgi:hypothetical protein
VKSTWKTDFTYWKADFTYFPCVEKKARFGDYFSKSKMDKVEYERVFYMRPTVFFARADGTHRRLLYLFASAGKACSASNSGNRRS